MTYTPFVYRAALTEADLAAIRILVTSAGVFSEEEIDVAIELAEDRLAHPDASTYRFILAERDGLPVGYACFGRIPLTDERYDFYWLVVDGNAQQQGVATALLDATVQAIETAGGKALYAETSSRAVYAPAHEFYRKRGFTLLARIADFYAADDDKLIYGKTL